MKLFIIDSLSPFLHKCKKDVINWSKIHYDHLERNNTIHTKRYRSVYSKLKIYLKKIKEIGFNAVSFDDLAHLTVFDFYPDNLKNKINSHKKQFKKIFSYLKKNNLGIYITTDIMFFNNYIQKHSKNNKRKIFELLKLSIENLFYNFQEIDGIIFRIGECDGVDVKGDFKSKIYIKSPLQANTLLKKIIPIFEKNNKLLIFRTWTLGAYGCGDLMWNEKTFLKIFGNIKSEKLVISLKYGNADFFRYLKLNKLFFLTDHKKIIELQTRREYEGFGEYPSFVGFDYYRFYKQLQNNKNMLGIYVWCQTGGWTSFKSFTFLKNTSFWNELNTYTTIKIFKDKMDLKTILEIFFYKNFNKEHFENFIKFLKYSDIVIKNLLYDKEFAKQELYFNKVRIHPLLYAFWDNVSINSSIIDLLNSFVVNKKKSLKEVFKALSILKKMGKLSLQIGLPYKYNFHYDTFRIIAYCRKLIYSEEKTLILKKLKLLLKKYYAKYKQIYKFNISKNIKQKSLLFRFIIKILFRKKSKYRFIDRLIFNRFVSFFILIYIKINKRMFPKFVNNQGMPLDIFFK